MLCNIIVEESVADLYWELPAIFVVEKKAPLMYH